MNSDLTVAVVGNPNCGKTTLFNALTGSKQHVGNWPGVTVEKKSGEYVHAGLTVELVDLPGTYSLEAADDHVSLDEKVARDYVASGQADLVINILDAANIERNLYLTTQLLEMRVPMLLVLNMMDTAKRRGVKINFDALSVQLGCPVVPVTATARVGLAALKTAINKAAQERVIPHAEIQYCEALEEALSELSPLLKEVAVAYPCDRRWLAIRLLEDDTLAKTIAGVGIAAKVAECQARIEGVTGDEIDILAADARYVFVNQLTRSVVSKEDELSRHTSEKIDRVVLNRYAGIPIFLMVMYVMFMFTINVGSAFIDFFDQTFGALLVDGLGQILADHAAPDWLNLLLTKGIGSGIQVVATFIPIVGCLFLFLSALEDSGYMARAAFVMDRFMRMLGLPGKSFVPMIVGFGCNVPAIMATRTLENPRDRILTNMMNPFMSCGARLPVYALFAAAFFPVGGQNLVFALYIFGIAVAVLTGLVMRHTLFKGGVTPFIMELPSYHLPTVSGVCIRTWDRLKSFLFNAGKVIVPMVLILNCLNSLAIDGSFGHENTDKSVLSAIGRSLTPMFKPIGIADDNWPATVGIFTGILAKEAVVGTLDALYGQMGAQATILAQTNPPEFELKQALADAIWTIPANLAGLVDKLMDPLGINIGVAEAASGKQEATFAAMQRSFDGQAGAFAYLLFILLYTPCVTATAAIFRETNLSWTLLVVAWTTGIAYAAAMLFYQTMSFQHHPAYSLMCINGLVGVVMLVGVALWWTGRRYGDKLV